MGSRTERFGGLSIEQRMKRARQLCGRTRRLAITWCSTANSACRACYWRSEATIGGLSSKIEIGLKNFKIGGHMAVIPNTDTGRRRASVLILRYSYRNTARMKACYL